jgi:CRISPR-associated endonuclease Csn1
MSRKVLGLDLGPNSIGWAIVEENAADSRLIDIGVRVFPEGVDAFDTAKETSRNEDRRVTRGMRRQVRRRAVRRRRLMAALVGAGLLPGDAGERAKLQAADPYALRAKAVAERLSLHEFGRVLMHLNQRRGFLSNRKKDRSDKEVEGMLAEINANEARRKAGGFATIGAMLADIHAKTDHKLGTERVRHRHLARQQFVDEFHLLWDKQSEFYGDVLTDELKFGRIGGADRVSEKLGHGVEPRRPMRKDDAAREGANDLAAFGIFGLMFFQRRMYWPKSVVGLCELEAKEKRCARGDRAAERFRLYQELNNLRNVDPNDGQEEQPLSEGHRVILLKFLTTHEKMTFDQMRKKLGLLDSIQFNLERGKRSAIKGMVVDCMMAKAVGDWHERAEDEKDAIVRMLLDNEREDVAIAGRLTRDHGFTDEEADAALGVDFPPGYGSLSLKAINKLLPHLERGLVYQSVSDPEQSALHAAGYLRRDELQRRLFDELPDLARLRPGECRLGDIPNPVVKRALVELRKLVNAIIRQYGRPDAIHVEMARSVQMGAEKRKEYNSRIRAREAEREKAAEAVRKMGVAVRRDSITRYLLWQEQSHECLYCGKPISLKQLFSGEGDVDHILPYSRCLDDSHMNKVTCHRECNHKKGQRTAYEWLAASDPDAYARVCQQAASLLHRGLMPYPKYRRFLQKDLELDKFIARQLTDTGYITRATVEYMRLLFDKDHDVLGLKGQLTAELRWQWGLDTILSELSDSPAWTESGDLRPGEKNRADHRHHAIDALVVALTNRRRLHRLSELMQKGGARKHGEILDEPWPDFRESVVERLRTVKVSHRVERKVRGALHEETLYEPTEKPGEWVVRKPVEALSPAEVERIRDPAIQKIVLDRLREHGIEFGRGKQPDANKMKEALTRVPLRMLSKDADKPGVPIKKVRIIKPELTIRPLRMGDADQAYVKPGATHHLAIFEFKEKGKTKREAVFVTMLEAMQRLKEGKAVIDRRHPERDDATFVMSLSSREMVLAKWKGDEKLLTFKTAASTQGQIYFAEHTDARRSSEHKKFVATANSLDARKVTVDPLGRIRWAND